VTKPELKDSEVQETMQAVLVDVEVDSEESNAKAEGEGTGNAETSDNQTRRVVRWARVFAYGVLPGLVLLLAVGAGYLKWLDTSTRDSQLAASESVRAATDSTIAMLSYKPDTVEKDLGAASGRLTGKFKDSYNSLTHDVVIPGAKQKRISTTATVPAAASVSASENHAVVLVFVNQTLTIGNDAPADNVSSVRVALDKVQGRWLISDFTPI
jgi:Mce-associated membrane protein